MQDSVPHDKSHLAGILADVFPCPFLPIRIGVDKRIDFLFSQQFHLFVMKCVPCKVCPLFIFGCIHITVSHVRDIARSLGKGIRPVKRERRGYSGGALVADHPRQKYKQSGKPECRRAFENGHACFLPPEKVNSSAKTEKQEKHDSLRTGEDSERQHGAAQCGVFPCKGAADAPAQEKVGGAEENQKEIFRGPA